MKKQIKYLVIALIASLLFGSLDVFAATTPTQSKITDTKSPYYYNNNLQQNGALSSSAKSYATNPANKANVDAIIAKNGGQCGINCAKDMEAAAVKSSNNTVDNKSNNTVDNKSNNTTANKLVDNNSTDTNNLLGIETGKLRRGDVNMHDIAKVILSVIRFLLAIAGTVAVFSLIYHAVKMQLNSGITGDSSGVESAKKGMTSAIIGFVIAISAWFLVTRVVQILIEVS